jgi:hypothetical protein
LQDGLVMPWLQLRVGELRDQRPAGADDDVHFPESLAVAVIEEYTNLARVIAAHVTLRHESFLCRDQQPAGTSGDYCLVFQRPAEPATTPDGAQ